jgi:hypothetical protein
MKEVHSYNEDHKLIIMTVKDMLKLKIENWEYNRPPDEIRCNEIANHYTKFNVDILQPFYFHYRPKVNRYEVLDGIHRYTGLIMMNEKELMYDKIVFIHIFTDLMDGMLIDIFQNINKTVPVPKLYISANNDDTEKQIIEYVTKDWIKKYTAHFSPNPNCNVPNINRDTFIELLTYISKSYQVCSKEKLEEILQKANQHIKDHIQSGLNTRTLPNKFSEKQKEKCVKTGCYLFLYRPDIIKTIIC